jgi:hypothetical protein
MSCRAITIRWIWLVPSWIWVIVDFTPRQKTSTRNPHANTVLPVSRATRTPTRPDSPDSNPDDDMPGQSVCPVTPSLSDQCGVTQQPATGASRCGAWAPIADTTFTNSNKWEV